MTAPAAAAHAEPGKFHLFVRIAMVLAVITSVEIVLIYLPLPRTAVYAALGLLSAVKFLFVIFYFMHLKWDKALCTVLFVIGLILGGGTLWALLHLFGAGASKPLTASAAAPAVSLVA